MKKFSKEIIICLIQLFVFYILPQLIGNIGALAMVFLLLASTLLLSIIMGYINKNKIKYCYPVLVSVLFIPTIWIYYNESALVHVLWYFVISSIGLILGMSVKKK